MKSTMTIKFSHGESSFLGYKGIHFDEKETHSLLNKGVKDKLTDSPQRTNLLNHLNTLLQDTGFQSSQSLLTDIQALENPIIDVQNFRIGEALAEVVLEKKFQCRFSWNELRDARNPKANKTGADLVGFIEIDNEILFLFGEVKTSSEQKSPPQVMTNPDGIENQLKDLYDDQQKRRILISYIQNKIGLVNNNAFKNDFDSAIKSYYRQNGGKYLLYGVLVRDTQPNEIDVKQSFDKLKNEILEPIGLKLLAIYLPIPKDKWLNVINGANNESN
ncbi:MAG: hypothetical protein ACP5Q5_11210 [Brevinematia bacterium]